MTITPGTDGEDPLLADLFDELLQELLEGREPDLAQIARTRPEVADKVHEAYELACSVAGRHDVGAPTIAGYQVIRELGRGGMGTVYLAQHENLDREVALKVLPPSLGLSPRAKQRFIREARSLARLQHENIVRIHQIVVEGDLLAYEMEFVDGPSLQQALEGLRGHGKAADLHHLAAILGTSGAQLRARTLVQYFARLGVRIGRALATVHDNGLVHRDIKPSNILLQRDGKPLLADFGLARGNELSITRTGAFAGTPIYASPEQLRAGDEDIDARSDVYSLAVTLYEAIALTPPFAGRSTAEVLRRIESGRIPPIRSHAPHVSRDLETILQKAMELDPRHRYATAADFADDLERLLQLQPIQARRAGPVRRTVKFARRHRRTLVAGAVGAALVAAALVPVLGTADAAAAAVERTERAERRTHQARLELVAPGGHLPGWTQAALGPGLQLRRLSSDNNDPLAHLRTAVRAYEEAAELAPADSRLQLERDVVRLALWLRTESPDRRDQIEEFLASPEFAQHARSLPPVTAEAARRMVAGEPGPADHGVLVAEVEGAEPRDRLALGLLALLLGDFHLCELSWAGLDSAAIDNPLLDAGLGLLYRADSRPQRAYSRLLTAIRTFPEAGELTLVLAEVALAMGEVQLARDWLTDAEQHVHDPDADPRVLCLRADLLASAGDFDAARQDFAKLARSNPEDPIPPYRLAQLAMREGDWQHARDILAALLGDWPEIARFHLEAARIALQLEDLPGYLAQASAAVTLLEGGSRSTGTAAALLEILRIGGLTRLHKAGCEATGLPPASSHWTGFAKPLHTWAPAPVLPRIEDIIEVMALPDPIVTRASRLIQTGRRTPLRVAWGLRLVGIRLPLARAARHACGHAPLMMMAALVEQHASDWLADNLTTWLASLATRELQVQHGIWPALTGGPDPNLRFGVSLGTPGDVDGDGVGDLLVGAHPEDVAVSRGRAAVFAGSDGAKLLELTRTEQTFHFGFVVAGAGDVDGDGVPDLAVGAPVGARGADESGRAWVFSGRDGAVLHEFAGDLPGFGVSLAGVGDVNGDGRADIVVGTSPGLRNSAVQGTAHVFSGANGNVLHTLRSGRAGVWFGAAVAAAGDVDGDGTADIIVGGNHGLGAPGLVRVYSGRDASVLHTWLDDSPNSEFGRFVGTAGDVDRDGHDDVLVGAPGSNDERARAGKVLTFSGADGRLLRTLRSEELNDGFGFSAVVLGDVDGDGHAEVAVGAPFGGPMQTGFVRVFSGRDGWPLRDYFGVAAGVRFGGAVAAPGDLDGDGKPDLAVAAPFTKNGTMWVFPGSGVAPEGR